jgi:hypothetical protein
MPQFFGKYRGVVVNNTDPMQLARIQATVPAVAGDGPLGWALPCSPFAGPDMGLVMVPPVGANVWIEFEGGDLDHPIWSGCFWDSGQMPAEALSGAPDAVQVLKAPGFLFVADANLHQFRIEVNPPLGSAPMKLAFDEQGILLDNSDATKLEMTPDGIEITNAASKIVISPGSVDINDGALEIT